MGTSSRRQVLVWTGILAGGAGIGGYLMRAGEPPSEEWLRARIWGESLVAYANWGGVPRVVLRQGDRLDYDSIVPGDWFWPNWPPAPQWQLRGAGYSIAVSDDPATVGFGPCPGYFGEDCGEPFQFFGQINDPAIVDMDVRLGDTWQRFAVAPPGYVIRLDAPLLSPTGFRWLDADGKTVWEMEAVSPTRPGMRGPRHRRKPRKWATPDSRAVKFD